MDSNTTDELPDLLLGHLPDHLHWEYHPAQDPYVSHLAQVREALTICARDIQPLHLEIIKQHHSGRKTKEIAEALNVCDFTVRRVRSTPIAKKMLALMAHLKLAQDGPHEAQRRNILWRIIQDNYEKDPRVAITAIAELNKMQHNERMLASGLAGGGNTLEIVINTPGLQRSPLDG